ncbi:MAG: ribose-phosphate pyrophosphokinase [Bacteroidales bacterium]|nr:ribose-phosphate pyrophosphokinase [Bacteroidales bacterium]
MLNNVKIFSCRSSKVLGEKISLCFGQNPGNIDFQEFKDGECRPAFEETVRGKKLYIVQSTNPPADNLFELLLVVDAAKRASAVEIVAVIPYFGYARQDRKDRPRVPISSKLVTNLLTAAGVTRVITMDLHADQIQGFFDVPVDHLYASAIFLPDIIKLNLPNPTMASPDVGGTRRAVAYAKVLKVDFALIYKQRAKPNVIEKMIPIGEIEGKDIIMIDDIIDTGGTITKATEVFFDHGARSVRAYCTHPVLSGDAYEKIQSSKLTEMVVCDTLPLKGKCSKIRVLSVANLFADVIKNIEKNESISAHFAF